MAWATTWVSVIWTSGDIATETKMDNMVANDIAYDSHSGEGLLLDNNVFFSSKDTGATRRPMIGLDASDGIEIGTDNVNDHTTINAGTDKLVKIKVLRQDDTTDTYSKDQVILMGWGQKQGIASTAMTEAVSFGITFSSTPVVIANFAGYSSPAATTIADLDTANPSVRGYSYAPTTSGFTMALVRVSDDGAAPGNFVATDYYGYTWIAIGTL